MASTEQVPVGSIATVNQHKETATPTTYLTATSTDPPKNAVVTFTQQDSPLLRLPGELRNRIYHEIFQCVFKRLERTTKEGRAFEHEGYYHPRVLRLSLARLTVCRQIHHEMTALFMREYFARKSYWRLLIKRSVSSFFARTTSLCRALERCAPHARFAVEYICCRGFPDQISPATAKAFVEELVSQTQQVAHLSFYAYHPRLPNTMSRGTTSSDLMTWDSHWKLEEPSFKVKGFVGECDFTYSWFWDHRDRYRISWFTLAGCLAQLDWVALKKVVDDASLGVLRN